MKVGGHRKIGRQKLRWSYVIKKRPERERSKERRRTWPENVEIENSMRRPQILKRPTKEKENM